MFTEETMRKLHEMRLTVMARTLREQLQDPAYNDMPFEDHVGLLVDREWCARKNNQLARLKKAAHFADPSAGVKTDHTTYTFCVVRQGGSGKLYNLLMM